MVCTAELLTDGHMRVRKCDDSVLVSSCGASVSCLFKRGGAHRMLRAKMTGLGAELWWAADAVRLQQHGSVLDTSAVHTLSWRPATLIANSLGQLLHLGVRCRSVRTDSSNQEGKGHSGAGTIAKMGLTRKEGRCILVVHVREIRFARRGQRDDLQRVPLKPNLFAIGQGQQVPSSETHALPDYSVLADETSLGAIVAWHRRGGGSVSF